ncbi:MAG: poly-gamma-glutamate synthase PgsB [Candidatus Fimivivens sp.]
MQNLILVLFIIYILSLLFENIEANKNRRRIENVIYVNGTRGKSSVTRLIDAGLRASGKKVFCKTTGTLPMMIDTENCEKLIKRSGRANIKEQLMVLKQAAKESADILVAECMAVSPVLQHISQHKMMKSNIGIITNVRLDHTEEMGHSLSEICDSLCATIPKNGVVFTCEARLFDRIEAAAQAVGSKAVLVKKEDAIADSVDFPENVSLALAVCDYLGVQKSVALKRMAGYKRDPYALSLHALSNGALFINGLSINDPQSSKIVFQNVIKKITPVPRNLILLINNRPDRGYRTDHMLLLANALKPQHIWLIGASKQVMKRRLQSADFHPEIVLFDSVDRLPFSSLDKNNMIFAVGNIANDGHMLMQRIRKEATPYVL